MAATSTAPAVALVGATGAAGSTVLRVLEDRAFPLRELRVLASPRSQGTPVRFRGQELRIAAADEAALEGCDIVFFAAGSATSRELAPLVAAAGGVAVDKSSFFRMDPNVPLVVPEVNGELVREHRGIIANPNCVAIPLSVALAPLHRAFGLRHLTVATYQAASGAGRGLREELEAQVRDDAAGRAPEPHTYPHVLHGNVVPGGWRMCGDDTEEEVKVIQEVRRLLEISELRVGITTVRVPVAVGHSMAVWADFDAEPPAGEARHILEGAAGVRVVDEAASQTYPTPRAVAGMDEVHVGRIRRDPSRENGLALWVVADNLRKGAATNAVQVAELVLEYR
ncbi:MAG: aspartate-semialdehyde dehydrogenase [Candidatus Dormiibacterota bacterium]